MAAPIISVRNLSKRYRLGAALQHDTLRDHIVHAAQSFKELFRRSENNSSEKTEIIWALRDVSFDVQQGEVVGIIGRNGAGKSTLLKILSQITEPTNGEIHMRGRVASLLEVGTGFHSELTGRENIFLNGAILGMSQSEIKKKFDEILAFAEVEKFLDTPVKHYSSGMYVRLAFAVAAHLEPEILLVDEVLAVGDAQFQKKCLGKMQDVARQEGRTVLFVSHNMTAIKSLCSRAVLLESGQVNAVSDAPSVVRQYLGQVLVDVRERIWDDVASAPGCEGKVKLHKIRIASEGNYELLDVDTAFRLEIEFWNLVPEQFLNVSVVLYTADDVCVLNTASRPSRFAKGLVREVCHFPANFLNDGTYRVRLLIVSDARVLFDDNQIISFELADGARQSAWKGKWVGIVRAKFQWDGEIISAASELAQTVP